MKKEKEQKSVSLCRNSQTKFFVLLTKKKCDESSFGTLQATIHGSGDSSTTFEEINWLGGNQIDSIALFNDGADSSSFTAANNCVDPSETTPACPNSGMEALTVDMGCISGGVTRQDCIMMEGTGKGSKKSGKKSKGKGSSSMDDSPSNKGKDPVAWTILQTIRNRNVAKETRKTRRGTRKDEKERMVKK